MFFKKKRLLFSKIFQKKKKGKFKYSIALSLFGIFMSIVYLGRFIFKVDKKKL